MTPRDVNWVLVDVIRYEYLWPPESDEDAVYGFTHSLDVNSICADMLPPHVVTPVTKTELELAWRDYVARKHVSGEDASKIKAWLDKMPDEIAIIEREPYPFG